jgi:hypothetical protein
MSRPQSPQSQQSQQQNQIPVPAPEDSGFSSELQPLPLKPENQPQRSGGKPPGQRQEQLQLLDSFAGPSPYGPWSAPDFGSQLLQAQQLQQQQHRDSDNNPDELDRKRARAAADKVNKKNSTLKILTITALLLVVLSTHSFVERLLDSFITLASWTPERELLLRLLYVAVVVGILVLLVHVAKK